MLQPLVLLSKSGTFGPINLSNVLLEFDLDDSVILQYEQQITQIKAQRAGLQVPTGEEKAKLIQIK